jgi:L-threonylcarbamoyladenylate synthase
MDEVIQQAIEAMKAGGVIVYPTDTIYGLGADALSPEGCARVYELKGRPENNPIHVVVADLSMAETVVELTPLACKLAEQFLPGALTLVLPAKPGVAEILTGGTGTLGIRIPNHPVCLEIARQLGRPFTATSANISGTGDCRSLEAVRVSFGEKIGEIAYMVDGGELPESRASTVVDARGEKPIILRQGPVFLD